MSFLHRQTFAAGGRSPWVAGTALRRRIVLVATLVVWSLPAAAQYSLTGKILGIGASTSTSTGKGTNYSLVGGIGPVTRSDLTGGAFRLQASVVPHGAIFADPEPEPQIPTPVHWWKLDGDLRDEITGESGQSFNGSNFAPGRVDQAFEFRGTNYLVLGNTQGGFGTNDFTLTLWMTAHPRVVSPTLLSWRAACSETRQWRLRLGAQDFSSSQPSFFFYGPTPEGGTGQAELYAQPRGSELNVKDLRWHHVAVVRKGTNAVLYRDGQPFVAGKSYGVADLPHTAVLMVGMDPCNIGTPWSNDPLLFNNPLIGEIDEIKFYASALSPAMIAHEWKQSRPLPVSPQSPSSVALVSGEGAPPSFRWIINPEAGQKILPEELAGAQLEMSRDLQQWSPLPDAARWVNGHIELWDREAFLRSGCYYRVVFR